jgi:alpha-ribazole phosphatase
MLVHLVRHGLTQGNLDGKYIGTTDEPLCTMGISQLREIQYPPCERVYVSPMLRCVQTAETIYPNVDRVTIDDFREIDFGEFEGKDYLELSKYPYYQAWIDSNGTLPFPHGESREEFSNRCYTAFMRVVTGLELSSISLVVHGGTIMAIMQGLKGGNYFDYQLKNGRYVTVTV